MEVTLTVNGTSHTLDVPDNALLVEVLATPCLTGTQAVPHESVRRLRGAAWNARRVKSCRFPRDTDGADVTRSRHRTGDELHTRCGAFANVTPAVRGSYPA